MNKNEMLEFIDKAEQSEEHAVIMLAHNGEESNIYIDGEENIAAVTELIHELIGNYVRGMKDKDAAWEVTDLIMDFIVDEAHELLDEDE